MNIMAIVFICLGAFFALIGLIMVIPTGNKNTNKIKGTVLSCVTYSPELENVLEYAEKIDINKSTTQYTIGVEYFVNGQRFEDKITSKHKKSMGDKITFCLNNSEEGIINKKANPTLIGGIVGLLIGIGFVVAGILFILGII